MNSRVTVPNGIHDFDFLHGHWQVRNHRLLKRLQGCVEWETFAATNHAHALPAGIGNYDEFRPSGDWRPGFVGMSLRVYNPTTGLWSIYWLENQTGGLGVDGSLLPPVVGSFHDGVGIFEGDDWLDGRAIRVRYTWSHITPTSARWEQAMSADGGASWECNWIMDMTRSEARSCLAA